MSKAQADGVTHDLFESKCFLVFSMTGKVDAKSSSYSLLEIPLHLGKCCPVLSQV
ncbi:MAG: hypothetical protein HQL69_24335 [Magnetococcales bacterium]|nr:hypothetical protein [Magnetococcales bacterium]